MRVVGIKVLKNKLSTYVQLAAAGETVLVTDRDRVVAELGPPGQGRASDASDALLASLVKDGYVTPPLVRRSGAPPRLPVATAQQLADELDEDRADR